MSPYTAFDNNPVFWADPSGADVCEDDEGWHFSGADAAAAFEAIISSLSGNSGGSEGVETGIRNVIVLREDFGERAKI